MALVEHRAGRCNGWYFVAQATVVVTEQDQRLVTELKDTVRTSLRDGYPSVKEAAAQLGLSVRTLQRRLHEAGQTFSGLVECVRDEEARRLLRDPSISVAGIAAKLGYKDASHFSRAFRRWVGTSPRSYRRSCRRASRNRVAGPD